MKPAEQLTTTSLLAQAESTLVANGYTRVAAQLGDFPASTARIFEDEYGIVAVVVFETWGDLSSRWGQAQDSLVSILTRAVRKTEAKAWEGYLALLTPSIAGLQGFDEAQTIRYDTLRVRKLIASADDLQDLSSVERMLLPILPLRIPVESQRDQASALELLPQSLSTKNIPSEVTRLVVQAFREGRSLITTLYEYVLRK